MVVRVCIAHNACFQALKRKLPPPEPLALSQSQGSQPQEQTTEGASQQDAVEAAKAAAASKYLTPQEFVSQDEIFKVPHVSWQCL